MPFCMCSSAWPLTSGVVTLSLAISHSRPTFPLHVHFFLLWSSFALQLGFILPPLPLSMFIIHLSFNAFFIICFTPFLLTPQNVFLFFIHTSVLCLVFPCLVWSMLSIYDTFFFLSFFFPPSSPPANGKDLCWLCWSPSAEEFNEFDGLFAGSVLEVDNGF